MADFDAAIRAAGGRAYQMIGRRRALIQRWREVYAVRLHVATGDWTRCGYDWHSFSDGCTPAQRGIVGWMTYERETVPARVIVCPHERLPAIEIVGAARLPDFRAHGLDLMVWPDGLAWTMAFTHQDGRGGPYFCRREWAGLRVPGLAERLQDPPDQGLGQVKP